MTRQAMVERVWSAIPRFYENCKKRISSKKGYPKFKRSQIRCSLEYNSSGWKLSQCRRYFTFPDGFGAGTFHLWMSRDLHFYPISKMKRVRIVRQADGYYAQFCMDQQRQQQRESTTNRVVGLDVGFSAFYTDFNGEKAEQPPRHLRKAEKRLKQEQRRLS